MSKIALNAIGRYVGGVESYIYNLAKALLSNDQINNYYLLVAEAQKTIFEGLLKYENFKILSYNINCSNPVSRVLCENSLMLFDILRYKINLVHHLCNYIPFLSPYKSVVTIHDLAPFYYNENFPEFNEIKQSYKYFNKVASYVTSKAKRIITVSNFTKEQLLKYFEVDQNKIAVIGQSFDTRKDLQEINSNVLEKFSISNPYILAVSIIRPHKNFDFLVKVFNKLKSKCQLPHKLVIVGDIHFGAEKFLEELKGSPFKDEIIYLKNIEAKDLASLYKLAEIFVYPSLYEGFGIPILEAMNFNIPVIASNAASLPEVGGNACLYFDSCDENDACVKILTILNDTNLKDKLITNQKARLDFYSWNNVAERILGIYNNVLGEKYVKS